MTDKEFEALGTLVEKGEPTGGFVFFLAEPNVIRSLLDKGYIEIRSTWIRKRNPWIPSKYYYERSYTIKITRAGLKAYWEEAKRRGLIRE